MTRSDLKDRVILITGASRGIGYAAALDAAKRGAHVIAVARTVARLEELNEEIGALGGSITLVPLDLKDGAAIDRMGKAIFERWDRLDGLAINGGILGPLSPLPHFNPKDFAEVFEINVIASFRLLRSLDPLLRRSDKGRVVFVSSGAAESAKSFWGLYAASKAALNAMAKSYAGELAQTKIGVNVFYPGAVRTAMRAQAMPEEDPTTLPTPAQVAPKLVDLLSPDCSERAKIFDVKSKEFRDI